MKNTLRIAALAASIFGVLLYSAVDVEARGGRGGGRIHYGGGKHTTSHGGTFRGGSGSSHRGGTYSNPYSGNRYGTHK